MEGAFVENVADHRNYSAQLFLLPYKTSLRSVNEMPPIRCVILPTNVLGVVPQSTHLSKKKLTTLNTADTAF